jgi:hypothetical protein
MAAPALRLIRAHGSDVAALNWFELAARIRDEVAG